MIFEKKEKKIFKFTLHILEIFLDLNWQHYHLVSIFYLSSKVNKHSQESPSKRKKEISAKKKKKQVNCEILFNFIKCMLI